MFYVQVFVFELRILPAEVSSIADVPSIAAVISSLWGLLLVAEFPLLHGYDLWLARMNAAIEVMKCCCWCFDCMPRIFSMAPPCCFIVKRHTVLHLLNKPDILFCWFSFVLFSGLLLYQSVILLIFCEVFSFSCHLCGYSCQLGEFFP